MFTPIRIRRHAISIYAKRDAWDIVLEVEHGACVREQNLDIGTAHTCMTGRDGMQLAPRFVGATVQELNAKGFVYRGHSYRYDDDHGNEWHEVDGGSWEAMCDDGKDLRATQCTRDQIMIVNATPAEIEAGED